MKLGQLQLPLSPHVARPGETNPTSFPLQLTRPNQQPLQIGLPSHNLPDHRHGRRQP